MGSRRADVTRAGSRGNPVFAKEVTPVLDMKLALGFRANDADLQSRERTELLRYINLKLAANGLPTVHAAGGT